MRAVTAKEERLVSAGAREGGLIELQRKGLEEQVAFGHGDLVVDLAL